MKEIGIVHGATKDCLRAKQKRQREISICHHLAPNTRKWIRQWAQFTHNEQNCADKIQQISHVWPLETENGQKHIPKKNAQARNLVTSMTWSKYPHTGKLGGNPSRSNISSKALCSPAGNVGSSGHITYRMTNAEKSISAKISTNWIQQASSTWP